MVWSAGLPAGTAALFLELRKPFSKLFPESLDIAESAVYTELSLSGPQRIMALVPGTDACSFN